MSFFFLTVVFTSGLAANNYQRQFSSEQLYSIQPTKLGKPYEICLLYTVKKYSVVSHR